MSWNVVGDVIGAYECASWRDSIQMMDVSLEENPLPSLYRKCLLHEGKKRETETELTHRETVNRERERERERIPLFNFFFLKIYN